VQHPTWGGVSIPLPVPQAPLFSWSAKSRRRDPRRGQIRLR